MGCHCLLQITAIVEVNRVTREMTRGGPYSERVAWGQSLCVCGPTLSPEDAELFLEWGSSSREEMSSRRRELCG